MLGRDVARWCSTEEKLELIAQMFVKWIEKAASLSTSLKTVF